MRTKHTFRLPPGLAGQLADYANRNARMLRGSAVYLYAIFRVLPRFTIPEATLDTFVSAVKHLALPAITLSLSSCPPILQLTRNTMRQILRGDYIRSARSLGLPERTIRWYALKSVLLPVITMTAMTLGYLLGGTVLVETVFSWPGIGLYAVQGMQQFDYEPVLGVVIVAAAVYILAYLVADLLAALIDPRIRSAD